MSEIQAFVFTYHGLLFLKLNQDNNSIDIFSGEEDIKWLGEFMKTKAVNEPRFSDEKETPSLADSLTRFNGTTCVVIPLDYNTLSATGSIFMKKWAQVYFTDLKLAVANQERVVLGKHKEPKHGYKLGERLIYQMDSKVFQPWIDPIYESQNKYIRLYTGITLEKAKQKATENNFTVSLAQNDKKLYARLLVSMGDNVEFTVLDGIVVDCTRG